MTALDLPAGIPRRVGLFGLAAFFTFAGVNHFTNPDFYVAIMPPYLPLHLALVYASGVFEVLGGVGVLVPRLRRLAGYGLIALLIAVFPANLHMALHPDAFVDAGTPAWFLYLRLPFQLVFLVWTWWATQPTDVAPSP